MLLPSLQPLIDLLLGEVPVTPPQDTTFTVRNPPADFTRLDMKNLVNKPIPRRGCVIGWGPPSLIPIVTEPMDLADIEKHVYGGPERLDLVSPDPIGHIYTKYGGIVDLGHVRDHADITRYFAYWMKEKFKDGHDIPFDDDKDQYRPGTGERIVKIKRQGINPSPFQAAIIAAAISYDIAVWHEIATYGTWQDYSSFSPEDNFSNLLGAYLGFCACLTENANYDEIMPILLRRTLLGLLAQPKPVTLDAIQFLENKWYHYTEITGPFPSPKLFLDKRHIETGLNENRDPGRIRNPAYVVIPWRVTDIKRSALPHECQQALVTVPPSNYVVNIKLPQTDENGTPLRNFYSLEIRNPKNKDMTIFNNPLIAGQANSSTLGLIVEEIRSRLADRDMSFDKPD